MTVMISAIDVANSYSPGAITPTVARPLSSSKAIDSTFPSKYSLMIKKSLEIDYPRSKTTEYSASFILA